MKSFDLVVVGGGTAGISTAATIRAQYPEWDISIAIVDPSEKHYYQPLWTVVGAGVVAKQETEKDMIDYIPPGCEWIKSSVMSFQPEKNQVTLDQGDIVSYRYLVVAPGIQLNWDKISGLRETLGNNHVTSNYAYATADYTWRCIQETHEGNAIFTQPAMPIKCAGAPQKICYLAEDYFRKHGYRSNIDVRFCAQGAAIFGVPKYKAALEKVVKRKEISTYFGHELMAVDGPARQAEFRLVSDGSTVTMDFAMLHVTPSMSAPDFVKESLLANEQGWVEVDQYSLQHVRYPNIFSLGDASSLPCSKTGAAIRKQVPVLVANLRDFSMDKELKARYGGYASCPLVTGYGSAILAEFDYEGPDETFPFNQAEERFSMYTLKVYGLPKLYWNGMLRGLV